MEANRTWVWPLSPTNDVTVSSTKAMTEAEIDRLIDWLNLVKMAWYTPQIVEGDIADWVRVYRTGTEAQAAGKGEGE